MSDVVITVRGESERRVAPERALVRASVRADGPDRGIVVARVSPQAQTVRDGLLDLEQAGAVAEWSSGRVNVWSERPWNQDGRQLPLVHHAALEVTATFSDVGALSRWVTEMADTAGVNVDSVEWMLHPETRVSIEREVASDAVRAAVTRAEAYAAAIGRSAVTPVQIADIGLLASPGGAESAPKMMRAMAMDAAAPTFELRPADIVVMAAVEARFAAS